MKKDEEFEKMLAHDSQRGPSEDNIQFVRDQIRYMRDLEKRIEDAAEVLSALKLEKRDLEFSTLPSLFMQNKITAISLAEEGNMPAYEAKLRDHFHANIQADWLPEKRQAAFTWLEKHRLGDIVKTVFTIEVGRGNAKLAQKVQSTLRSLKIPFQKQQAVPWKTLTSAVKEIYRDGKVLKDAELEMLGANVGKIVTLQPKKDGR